MRATQPAPEKWTHTWRAETATVPCIVLHVYRTGQSLIRTSSGTEQTVPSNTVTEDAP